MNISDIATFEQVNDGSAIYLFKSSKIGVWTAYGKSAYALLRYVKRKTYPYLLSFADRLGLVGVSVDENTYKIIANELDKINSPELGVHFVAPETFEEKDYQEWVVASTPAERIIVEKSLDDYVPDSRYIKDKMSSMERNTKRFIDLLVSSIVIVIFAIPMLIVYILVKIEDGGPAIYKQERIGRFGHPFYIYKFRSMRLDAEKFGPCLSHAGGDDDPRLTKVGKFIRAHHLDEMPQLFNVFRGDMSFVGPRPERKFYIDQIMQKDHRYVYLYQIRPGFTSYATLYNGYCDTVDKMVKRLEYDLYYLEHRSMFFDMKILWRTFTHIIFGKVF